MWSGCCAKWSRALFVKARVKALLILGIWPTLWSWVWYVVNSLGLAWAWCYMSSKGKKTMVVAWRERLYTTKILNHYTELLILLHCKPFALSSSCYWNEKRQVNKNIRHALSSSKELISFLCLSLMARRGPSCCLLFCLCLPNGFPAQWVTHCAIKLSSVTRAQSRGM